MPDSQDNKKSGGFLQGLRLRKSSRSQPSPQPRADRSSKQTSDISRNQSPQPRKSPEPASKSFRSALQSTDSNDEVSNEKPVQIAETALKISPIPNTQPASSSVSHDWQQSKTWYSEAYNALRNAIAKHKSLSVNFEELSVDPDGVDQSMFMDKLHRALESQNSKVKDRSAWGTCKSIVKYLVHTFKPFAKNFLMIACEGSSVFSIPALSNVHRLQS
jgi:hypothetical protein